MVVVEDTDLRRPHEVGRATKRQYDHIKPAIRQGENVGTILDKNGENLIHGQAAATKARCQSIGHAVGLVVSVFLRHAVPGSAAAQGNPSNTLNEDMRSGYLPQIQIKHSRSVISPDGNLTVSSIAQHICGLSARHLFTPPLSS